MCVGYIAVCTSHTIRDTHTHKHNVHTVRVFAIASGAQHVVGNVRQIEEVSWLGPLHFIRARRKEQRHLGPGAPPPELGESDSHSQGNTKTGQGKSGAASGILWT
jgi:hypothetical protein